MYSSGLASPFNPRHRWLRSTDLSREVHRRSRPTKSSLRPMHASRIKSRAVECIQDRGPPSQVLGPMHASSPHRGTVLSRRARTGLPTTAVICSFGTAIKSATAINCNKKFGCVRTIKDWSTDRWKSTWNKRKDCLRMKESVGLASSRLTIHLFNLTRPQLNREVQVLTGHCNLQRYKKTIGRAESSLCPKCSLEDETLNHHVGICKLYQDIRVKYFGITETTAHDVVKKCNINKLATYLKEAGRLSEFYQ